MLPGRLRGADGPLATRLSRAPLIGRERLPIINKTAISYKANRKIGGNAPSTYLRQIERDKSVQLDPEAMDAILRSHSIDPDLVRADDFEGFFRDRRSTLLRLIEQAMSKEAVTTGESAPDDAHDLEAGN